MNSKEPAFVEVARGILDRSGNAPSYTLSVKDQTILNKYAYWSVINQMPDLKSDQAQERNLTRKEVATIFRISLPTLDKYIKLGLIEATKIGTRILFSSSSIREASQKIESAKFQRL